MTSPSFISRVIQDKTDIDLKVQLIYGLVQDAYIEGYSKGTDNLVIELGKREEILPKPVKLEVGDRIIAKIDYQSFLIKGDVYKVTTVSDAAFSIYVTKEYSHYFYLQELDKFFTIPQ